MQNLPMDQSAAKDPDMAQDGVPAMALAGVVAYGDPAARV